MGERVYKIIDYWDRYEISQGKVNEYNSWGAVPNGRGRQGKHDEIYQSKIDALKESGTAGQLTALAFREIELLVSRLPRAIRLGGELREPHGQPLTPEKIAARIKLPPDVVRQALVTLADPIYSLIGSVDSDTGKPWKEATLFGSTGSGSQRGRSVAHRRAGAKSERGGNSAHIPTPSPVVPRSDLPEPKPQQEQEPDKTETETGKQEKKKQEGQAAIADASPAGRPAAGSAAEKTGGGKVSQSFPVPAPAEKTVVAAKPSEKPPVDKPWERKISRPAARSMWAGELREKIWGWENNRREFGTTKFKSDVTSTPLLFDEYVWPEELTDDDLGREQFDRALELVNYAVRNGDNRIALLTDRLKNPGGKFAAEGDTAAALTADADPSDADPMPPIDALDGSRRAPAGAGKKAVTA